jgi:hypothetical protein
MKHKVAELEGALLDAAVAKATGDVWQHSHLYRADMQNAPYSTEWECGGPIIERERIAVFMLSGKWTALTPGQDGYKPDYWLLEAGADDEGGAATPLIAAMRAYVCSKFGEEVDL